MQVVRSFAAKDFGLLALPTCAREFVVRNSIVSKCKRQITSWRLHQSQHAEVSGSELPTPERGPHNAALRRAGSLAQSSSRRAPAPSSSHVSPKSDRCFFWLGISPHKAVFCSTLLLLFLLSSAACCCCCWWWFSRDTCGKQATAPRSCCFFAVGSQRRAPSSFIQQEQRMATPLRWAEP